jgi:hypothetical protein
VNDLTEEHHENEYDLMCVNSDSVSNEIDEIALEFENNMTKNLNTTKNYKDSAV